MKIVEHVTLEVPLIGQDPALERDLLIDTLKNIQSCYGYRFELKDLSIQFTAAGFEVCQHGNVFKVEFDLNQQADGLQLFETELSNEFHRRYRHYHQFLRNMAIAEKNGHIKRCNNATS